MDVSTFSPECLTREILLSVNESERLPLIRKYLKTQIERILRQSLSVADVQRSLIQLGIDSFMTGELSYLIESDFGVMIPLVDFFGEMTLEMLARRVFSELAMPVSIASLSDAPGAPIGQYPLSVGQQALWSLYQMSPDSTAYNIAYALRIRGALDVPALEHAWQTLVQRHASLRTTFTMQQGEAVQYIQSNLPLFFQQEDATRWSDVALRERLAMEAHTPFDLELGPLLRLFLYTCSSEEHILLIVIHHIITDFWSLSALIHEMGALYAAEQIAHQVNQAQNASIGSLDTVERTSQPKSYTDYVSWQADLLAGEKGEQIWAYWQKQLAGELPDLNLPTDRPRPPVQTYSGAAQSCLLDRELSQALKVFSQAQGVTLYVTLLAAFQVLLHRYTGQDQILLGTAMSGRSQTSFFDIAGYFVNSAVIRAYFEGNPSFVEFLQQVRQTEWDAIQNQEYPFATLVKRLKPERDFSRSPLFQAMFVYQQPRNMGEETIVALDLGVDGVRVNIPGLPFETVAVERQTSQFDLTLVVGEIEDRLALLLKYNTDLFDAASMERLLSHWQMLLSGIIADPHQRVSDLPWLTAAECQQILRTWNDTQIDFATSASTLPDMFETQAERTPNAMAVAFDGQQWDYQSLNQQANQLAHHLQMLGVGPEVRVGVCLERSWELVVGLLGILKAGGVYVPLDPAYPAERLAFMQADAQLAVLLTTSQLAQVIPSFNVPTLCLDFEQAKLARQSSANPQRALASENLAYIIYTSGSTGTPKGVMVPHQAICNHLRWRAAATPLNGNNRFLQLASISFDVSVWELLVPLMAGAQLVLPRPGSEKDIHTLEQLINDQQVTHLRMGPSLLSVFIERPGTANCQSLEHVICGGEMLSLDLQERFFATLPSTLSNQYGPTETCVAATIWHCERESARPIVPIGRPIANTRLYVLDGRLQPVPAGVAGELYIGGLGVARGYLNRPDLTAERFIPDPFSADPGARLYRTGDRVRYLADGNVEFLGRLDRQVKIRGFRVELGEVEAVLAQHPALLAVVVEARAEHAPLFGELVNDQLVAYVVACSSQAPTLGDLRSYLKQKLPDYMIPSAFVFLETLPLTPNGKVDRKALPALDVSRPDLDGAYEPPRTPVEEVLAEMWAALLEIEQVGIHDSFFELGGHSLLAVQSMATLQDLFAIEEPLIILFFENPTVAGLATVLTESLGDDAEIIAQKLRLVMEMSDEDVENMLLELENQA